MQWSEGKFSERRRARGWRNKECHLPRGVELAAPSANGGFQTLIAPLITPQAAGLLGLANQREQRLRRFCLNMPFATPNRPSDRDPHSAASHS